MIPLISMSYTCELRLEREPREVRGTGNCTPARFRNCGVPAPEWRVRGSPPPPPAAVLKRKLKSCSHMVKIFGLTWLTWLQIGCSVFFNQSGVMSAF